MTNKQYEQWLEQQKAKTSWLETIASWIGLTVLGAAMVYSILHSL